LVDYLIGTGGWAYFNVPGQSPLKAYGEIFSFVEVNYTFYQYPSAPNVEKWRRTVPLDFTFSVKCHRDLTHRIGLKPVDEAYEIFYKAKGYAAILQTPYLVMETPATFIANDGTRNFLSSLNLKGIRLVWEYRAQMTSSVAGIMKDFGIIQADDLSREKPTYNLDVTYSRLFGKGQQNIYQFTNDELTEIQQRVEETGSKKVLMSYHGLRMNTDALRFQRHLITGEFPPVTSAVGLDSAKSVLAEDAVFPSSKSKLIETQGWKVIDVKNGVTAHLSEYLKEVPDKVYSDAYDLLKELKAIFE